MMYPFSCLQSSQGATNAVIELSSSSSESEVTVGDTAVKPRPKLRTRRIKVVEERDDHTPDSPDVARPAKRRRETSKQIQYFEDDVGQEEEEEEADEDATGDYVDQVETPSEDEKMPEEDPNRRRSGRKRKTVQSVIDLSDDDFIMSSGEEEKPKPKAKPKKNAAKSKAKGKRKRKSSPGDSSEEESEEDSEVGIIERVKPESDGFIIDKMLAREVHTQKEWKKICWNKNTRFLTHCSIFLPPEEEEKEKQEEKKEGQEQKESENSTTAESQTLSAPKLSTDDDEVEDAGEERFLVKWKTLSYLHTSWQTEEELLETDKNAKGKIQRFREKELRAFYSQDVQGDEYFNPEFRSKIALAKHLPQIKRKNFRGYTAESPPPRRKEQTFQLRDYQLTGVNWMLFNWYQKRNSMLADEMGLGKTVQTVMYVNHLAVVERSPQPFIIVAPLSTLGHWQREFDSWTNLNAVVYHGSAAARDVLQNYEFFMSEDELLRADELTEANNNGKRAIPQPKRNCYRFDVLITTYEMASATDLYKLAQIDWQLMVVDEAHRLKNRNSKLSNILHTRFTYENMLLLTGTPLQNNVEELWVLLNFLDTKKFASKESFLESFGELTDSAQVERLHSELKPYLLRRMKEDVEKSLAPKEETIIEVELTVLQKQYYRAIYEKNTEFLSRGGRKGDTPSLMNVLMELRKCCNHPFLVKGVEEREVKRLAKQPNVAKEEIQRQISESLVDTSGKLVLLDKLLPRLKETGHRVLIFSQFKIMLDIIQDYLALRRYNCERIDGNITGNERQSAIDRFCREDSNSFIMLLSTRAGGVGINLTAADTVIIYDSDWNPQNDLQAQARCHRIGQKKSVKIYRLLTAKTYELHMFHKASLKLGLDQAVLGGIKNDDPVGKLKGAPKKTKTNDRMSKEEIENLLKHGAYEMFKEQDSEAEAASKKFGEESIDQILSRSTTIVHDPTRDADGNEKKNVMSSFSKATFVSSTNPDEEDVKRHAPALQAYSDKELIKFVQDYITGMVRVTTAMTAFPRIGLDLEPSRVYIVSTTAPPHQMANASPIERYAHEMNSSLRRYRFLTRMLNDMRVSNLLAVAVPPRLWITDFKSRAARGFRAKLQQIDTMFKLSEFVRLKFVQVPPLVSLIKDLQKAGDEATVHRMIESGTVPEPADVTPVEEKESAPVEEKPKEAAEALSVKVTAGESSDKDTSKNEEGSAATDNKAPSKKDEDSASTDQSQQEASAAPAKIEAATEAEGEKPSPAEPDEAKSSSAANETTEAGTPSTSEPPSDSTAATVADATGNQGDTKTTNSPSPSGEKDDKSVSVAAASSESKSPSEKSEAEIKKDDSFSGEALKTQLKDDSGATKEMIEATAAKEKIERKQAVRILRALPPVNSPEPVAPWWISRVDDVMLLLYVYHDGWIKGRTLPSRLVDSTTMFGDPPATSIATALNITSAKYQRQHEKQQQLLRQREQQRAQQARHYINTSSHSVRHNQFAKLVFSYGIPDVSTCRDKRERNEKWRYFLQDSQLEIGHCPLEELLAEALDLERVCRQRLRANADGMSNSELSEDNSILGGKRGFWLLTTTQCRRLLHRVDLFRLLRTQILVLPPAQLVELVTRVVRAQSASTEYPGWWSSPRHDILLLQGVECYGLDEHLASVWKLPLFSSANKTSSFPSSSWVENHVTALALACRNLVVKARSYRSEGYIDLSNDESNEVPADNKYPSRPGGKQEGETRRRIRDIRGMREEDPHFVPSVRLRQIIEKQQQVDRHSDKVKTQQVQLAPAEESALMQREDPYASPRARAVWTEQIKREEIETTKKRSSGGNSDEKEKETGSSEEKEKVSQSSDADVIHLESENDDDNSEEEEKSSQPPSSLQAKRPVRRAAAAAIAAAKAKRENSKPAKDDEVAAAMAEAEGEQPAASAWDVIVIDSSEDSD
ncbi:hypothetical protein JG688_00013428 [Phytophthora aleatoria]|uniref:Chromodomain-helicase-DNA-binding protein 6 n=1 Tax=Phytophthora aleatoria TaxID=2496075 RepID=A0A8J5M405_9STRA|nr:hypothetical protein JG688_00013428 [Phytophthora aleatoria]